MGENGQRQRWISQAKGGDTLAVSKLLAAYHPALHARAVARMEPALLSRLEPEDLLQDVYFQVLRCMGQFAGRDPDSFLNWVLTILDNELVNARQALHRKKRDIARDAQPPLPVASESYWNLLDHMETDAHTPSRIVRCEEAVGALQSCLSRLPTSYAAVVHLRFLEGLSVAETARELDKSEAAVVALTKRALDALRAAMNHLGEFTRGS